MNWLRLEVFLLIKKLHAPCHRRREHCERQREQRVAEADEFEEVADCFEHSEDLPRRHGGHGEVVRGEKEEH